MSLIKLNLVKFTKQIASEIVSYSPDLLKYADTMFVIKDGRVSMQKKDSTILQNYDYYITLFRSGGSFGSNYWHLRLEDIGNVRYKPINKDIDDQYDTMLYNLNLVIEFIKKDLVK